ncbi:unnamed protein product [Didymodactylos carnosus]|uniref:Uncharacterized protein n=1 Tax=Didymodactylos carnosus TaxID=1234261 RepID=A0A8S2D8H0_9BILA|nr:unnamed protein product [Didymodactylos carnosus]CAF3655636.1 unnamed protein product [Didymodactylos carnosus]
MEQNNDALKSDDICNEPFVPQLPVSNENSNTLVAVYLPQWHPSQSQLPQDRSITHLFEQVYNSILSQWSCYRSELPVEEIKNEHEYIVDEPITPVTQTSTPSLSSIRRRDVDFRSNLNETIRYYSADRSRRASHPLPGNSERSRSYESRLFNTQHASRVQIMDKSRKLTTPVILPTSLITSYENLKSVNNEPCNSSFSSACSSESQYYSMSTTAIIQDQTRDLNPLPSTLLQEQLSRDNKNSQSSDKTTQTSFLPVHRKRTINTSSRISRATSFDTIDQSENSDKWIHTTLQNSWNLLKTQQETDDGYSAKKVADVQLVQEEPQKIVKVERNLLTDEVNNWDQPTPPQEKVGFYVSNEKNILFSNFINVNFNNNCENSMNIFDIDDRNEQQTSNIFSVNDEDKSSVMTLTDTSLTSESSSSFAPSLTSIRSATVKNTNNNTEEYFERLTKSIEPSLKKSVLTNNINKNKTSEKLIPPSLFASNSNFSDTNRMECHDLNDDVFTTPIPKQQEKRVSFSPQIIKQSRENYVRSPSLPPTPPPSIYHSNLNSPLFKLCTSTSSSNKNRAELPPIIKSEFIGRKSIIIPKNRRPDFVKVLSDNCHCSICLYFDRRQLKTNINLENALYQFLESKDIATTIITYIKSQDYKIQSTNLTFDIDINLLKELRMPKGFLEWFYTIPKFSRALLSLVKNINEFYRHCPLLLSYVFIIEFAIFKPICLLFYYVNWFLKLDMDKRFQLTLGIPSYFKKKPNDDDEESDVSETELFFIKWHWAKVPILFEDYYSNSPTTAYYETDEYHNLKLLFQSHEDNFQNNTDVSKIEFDDLFEDYKILYSIEHVKAYLTNVHSTTITFNEQNNRIPTFIETNDNENNYNYHHQLYDYDERKCLQHNRKPLKLFNCLTHLLENIYGYYHRKTFQIKQYEQMASIVKQSSEYSRRNRKNDNNYDNIRTTHEMKRNHVLKDSSTSPIQLRDNNLDKESVAKNEVTKPYHYFYHNHLPSNDSCSLTRDDEEVQLSKLPPPLIPPVDVNDSVSVKTQPNKKPYLFNSGIFEFHNNNQPNRANITLPNGVDSVKQQQQSQENASSLTVGDGVKNSTSLLFEKLPSSITTNEKDKKTSSLPLPPPPPPPPPPLAPLLLKSQNSKIKQQHNIFETPIRQLNPVVDDNVINYITPQSIVRHSSLSKDKIPYNHDEQMNNMNKDEETKFHTRVSSLTVDERKCSREKSYIIRKKDNTEDDQQRQTYLSPSSSNDDKFIIKHCIYDSSSELSSSESGGVQNFTTEALNECCIINEKIELNMSECTYYFSFPEFSLILLWSQYLSVVFVTEH